MQFEQPVDMSIYEKRVEDLPSDLRAKVTVVKDNDALNKRIANEFVDALAAKEAQGEILTVICPVGPVDYAYVADEIKRRGMTARSLRTLNMDEYVDDDGHLIDMSHPLSFRRFMEARFFSQFPDDVRPLPENICFPDPQAPERTTEIIDAIGGADLCWTGCGITGHLAFNDPPRLLGEPTDLESYRNCKTRVLRCADMSTAQMAMGGTHGNLDLVPERAVTVGMYEILKTRRFNLIMMRNWHAGLWRRALLGPVTSEFPGSYLQDHPDLTVTLTELAAAPPVPDALQDKGEEG